MREEKKFLLDEVEELATSHNSFVITRYNALTVNKSNAFRREVAKVGGNVQMMKKRLLMKAAEKMGMSLTREVLPGHISVVFTGTDAIETLKLVCKFAKESDKAMQVIGGRFDGALYSANQVEQLSQLPSKDEMRAQLLATLEAPMSHTLGAMDALLCSVVYCLDNKCKEQSE